MNELDELRKEVAFYRDNLPRIYDEITGSVLSYPNYTAEAVLSAFYDAQKRRREDWGKDYEEDNEIPELRAQLQSQSIALGRMREVLRAIASKHAINWWGNDQHSLQARPSSHARKPVPALHQSPHQERPLLRLRVMP